VLVDARHGRYGATGTPPKLRWNMGRELELNYRGYMCVLKFIVRMYLLSRRGISEALGLAARGSRLPGDLIRHRTYLGAINS